MIGKLAGVGLLMLAACPAVAADRVNLYFCDGCSVEQERAMVRGLTGEMGTFDFYVGNFPAQTIHKYQLARGWSNPPCSNRPGDPNCNQEMTVPTPLTAQPISPIATIETYVYDKEVEPPYTEAYQYLVQFYYTEPVGFKKFYEFQIIDPAQTASAPYQAFYRDGNFFPRNTGILGNPINPVIDYPDPNTTVFDISRAGAKRDLLLDSVRSNMLQRVNIGMDNVAKVLSALGIIDNSKLPGIDVIVYLADGGKATLRLNNSTTVPVYEIVEDSLRDSHGNPVPIQPDQLAKQIMEFDYTGSGKAYDIILMRNQLEFLGAGVQEIQVAPRWQCGSVLSSQGTVTVTCRPR